MLICGGFLAEILAGTPKTTPEGTLLRSGCSASRFDANTPRPANNCNPLEQ